MRNRIETLGLLTVMPQAPVAGHDAILAFIDEERLFGLGIGFVDVHLLASARSDDETLLWTRDRRLRDVAARFEIAFEGPASTP